MKNAWTIEQIKSYVTSYIDLRVRQDSAVLPDLEMTRLSSSIKN